MTNQTTAPHSGSRVGRAVSASAAAAGSSVDARSIRKEAPKASATQAAPDFSDVVDLSRRRPVPQLLLPIVGPPPAPRATPSPPHALPPPPRDAARTPTHPAALGRALVASTPPAAFERSVASPPPREFAAVDAFGFAAAWVMTTAAGALVCGHLMARSQPPVVVHVPDAHVLDVSHAAAEPPSESSSCAKSSWEPPLVAVGDLPAASQPRSWPQRAVASNDVAPVPTARPSRVAQEMMRQSAAQTKVWPAAATRHARFAGPAVPSAGKAKAAPKTLEEWMRASVDPG